MLDASTPFASLSIMANDNGLSVLGKTALSNTSVEPSDSIKITITPIAKPEPTPPTHLVISPYTDAPHLLDLRTVGIQEQLLAHAFIKMRSLREDYARAPYLDIFNFTEVIEGLRQRAEAANHSWKEQTFYIVVFRSQVPKTTDYSHLGDLDRAAHVEAVQSGGFLKLVFFTIVGATVLIC